MKTALIATVLILFLLAGGVWLVADQRQSDSNGTASSGQSQGGTAVLDYSGKGLSAVDASIYSKTATTELILTNNNLKTLPSQMGRLTNLRVLKLNNNALEGSLIAEVRQMTKLKELDVSNNKMTGMPAELGQLRSLETLDYSNNQITGLPNELANLKGNLKTFNLSGNPLSEQQIAQLRTSLPTTNVIFNN